MDPVKNDFWLSHLQTAFSIESDGKTSLQTFL